MRYKQRQRIRHWRDGVTWRFPAGRISTTPQLDTRNGLKRQSRQGAREETSRKRRSISQCRRRGQIWKRKSERRRRKWSRQSRDKW